MASTPANALEYFDNLERYNDGQSVINDGTYELILPEWDENQGSPYATSGNLGVTPYSGNRMIEMRTPSIGRPNMMRARSVRGLGEFPGWELSIKVHVSSLEFVGQGFAFGFNDQGQSHGISIHFSTGKCEVLGAFGSKIIPNLRDRWLELAITYDRTSKTLAGFVDGENVGQLRRPGLFNGLDQIWMASGHGFDISGQYPRSQGSPGVFMDDFSISSVPDPATIIGVGLGLVFPRSKRKRA